ncbi:TadE/TadG family type IV pilus assembly protein [Sphingomonas sp. XXL09]|uniref:TadE/TadG family type IV pilus assembly protein n=1 Tax=Sphingomonas sp. XXL09 TaxID=3457787 RepID=UPI00406BA3EF
MIRKTTRSLASDRRAATLVEFAIVCPVMLILMMGLGELAYQGYVQSVLTGAIQRAGRNSTIQAADTTQLDQAVMQQVWKVVRNATYVSTRKSYSNFSSVAPEPFVDTAGTGVYNQAQDCFTDINGNGTWDTDPGSAGGGGASDVSVYTMTITYRRLFPVAGLIGMPGTATLTGSTTLKNQPYATQAAQTATQICPH